MLKIDKREEAHVKQFTYHRKVDINDTKLWSKLPSAERALATKPSLSHVKQV